MNLTIGDLVRWLLEDGTPQYGELVSLAADGLTAQVRIYALAEDGLTWLPTDQLIDIAVDLLEAWDGSTDAAADPAAALVDPLADPAAAPVTATAYRSRRQHGTNAQRRYPRGQRAAGQVGFGATTVVKALDDGFERIGGYLALWGDPQATDLHGDYFSPDTEFHLDWYGWRPAIYDHGQDGALKRILLGKIDTLIPDQIGLWAEQQIDRFNQYLSAIRELVQGGTLGWSSGSAPHLIERQADGWLSEWTLIEGSLTPTPAEWRGTQVSLLNTTRKHFIGERGALLHANTERLSPSAHHTSTRPTSTRLGGFSMPRNPNHEFNGFTGGSSRLAPVKRLPLAGASRITSVTDLRYDHLTPEAAIFTANVLNQSGQRPTEGLLRSAAYKTLREAERGGAAYSPVVKALHYMKADEVLASNLSGAGQEWVGVAYEQRLWEKARQSPIYQQMLALGMFQVEIPKGANSVFIPAEGNDPTWYSLPEQNDTDATERAPITVKDSKVSTPRRQLTPGQLGARVMYTDVLDEDSLVPMAAILMQQIERSAQEIMEFVILNGDTATTANTNINLSDSTPSLDSKGRGPSYLAFDGILKLPLVTATALGRDTGVAFDEQDFLDTLKLLPKSERQTRERLMYILDSDALIAAMGISTFKTRDVFSPATIEEGILTRVYGIPVYESGQMGLAAATGKISATGANNTKGRLLIVRPDQWAVGFKRQIKTEVSRDIEAQSNTIVSTMRFAITSRSAAGGAALSYNVPV